MEFIRPKGILAGFSWSCADASSAALLEAGEHWVPRERPIGAHRNAGWEVYYQPVGRSLWNCEGREYEVGSGGFYLAAPGVRHQLIRFSEVETHFYFAVLKEGGGGAATSAWPKPFYTGANAHPLEHSFRGIVRELSLEDDFRAEGLSALACLLRIEVNRLLQRPISSELHIHPAVVRVCELFESQPAARWRLDEMASLGGVSVPHLVALFKRNTGQSPRQYLLQRRIEKAEQLLRDSGRSITDVAHELGFSSSQHFAKVYRSLRGHSARDSRQHYSGRAPG